MNEDCGRGWVWFWSIFLLDSKKIGQFLYSGMCHLCGTYNTEASMRFSRDLAPDFTYPLFVCNDLSCDRRVFPSSLIEVA
jgi:hypothetical protein